MPISPLTTVAAAVLFGVAGQVLASLTRIPAIVFLLVLGVAAGPYGLNVVRPADLGQGLPALTSAFVAVILFEGALTLRPGILRQALTPVRRLITWGAALTLGGATLLGHSLVGLPWPLALLFASLVVVTGPTVIAPILRRVPLRPRLRAVLKSESILIDPVGVFVAVVMLQYVVGVIGRPAGWADVLVGFFVRAGAGALVGGLAGVAGAALARLRLFHRRDSDHLVSLGALGLALATYVAAERVQSESGVMAVIVAGLILAAAPIPFREELEKFKDLLTTLGVSVLFILLAAHLNLALLQRAGWPEAALLAGLILVVRPTSVFLSTWGTELTWREKAYLSLLAPRGILAAAMAGYFADQLRQRGLAGANKVELLVFLTIAVTVFLQGGWAAPLARLLRVRAERPCGVLVVGVNEWSLALAQELRSWQRPVLFLDHNPLSCETARAHGFEAQEGDATDPAVYASLDLSAIGVLVAVTPNDAVNTLACEAARPWLGGRNVLQVVSKPAGNAPRSRVRMAGRRAMPTGRSHREVVGLLRRGGLRLDTEPLPRSAALPSELVTSRGPMVPLLVLEGGQVHVAVEGRACATSAVVVGLIAPGSEHPQV